MVKIVAIVALLGACQESLDIDAHDYACANDAQCGRGARCVDGVCRDAAAEPMCVVELAGGDMSFTIEGAQLVVSFGGVEAEFALPDEVIGLAEAGTMCCENPCCEP